MLFFKWPSIIELKQCVMPTDESQSHSNFFVFILRGRNSQGLTDSKTFKNSMFYIIMLLMQNFARIQCTMYYMYKDFYA